MTEQDTPREDPNFPDRPQHPDFWKLSEILISQDARSDENEALDLMRELIDPESLLYAARQRMWTVLSLLGRVEDGALHSLLAGVWVDAAVAGIQLGRAQAVLNEEPTS